MNLFAFFRSSLRGRLMLLMALWMVALAAILITVSHFGSRKLSEQIFEERERLAQALIDNLDNVLRSNLVLLQDAALKARVAFEQNDLRPLRTQLREFYLRSVFTKGAFLADKSGKIVLMEPNHLSEPVSDFSLLPPVRFALETGKPSVSSLVPDGKKRVYAVVPVRNWHGEIVGAVGGEGDPTSAQFRSLLQPIYSGQGSYTEIVDGNGIVLLSTKPGRLFVESDHSRFLAGLVEKKRSVMGTCHGCHEEQGFQERERELIAFAPSMIAPWGIAIRQSEREVMALVSALEWRLLSVGALTIPLALLFAWGAARSVSKPLGTLTRAARRIQEGYLEQPIPPLGSDEIGNLARSLDRMRLALKDSLETITEGKRELEKRVQERTRELERLYQELQSKEELRGELLKKVITVQEEERKRIARELHDDTSQALATLLLSLQTTTQGAPGEARERLAQMKVVVEQTLESIHRLIFNLRPAVLDDLGLVAALRWAAEAHLEPMGIDVSFDVLGRERRLAPEMEITLFRVGQESISNIAKHAEADSVTINIEFGENTLTLSVEDDGLGFRPEEVSTAGRRVRGLGLLGMEERVALIGGELTVHSVPGKGTNISVMVPVIEAERVP